MKIGIGLNGRKMTERVRNFNDWSEEFMVEASRPLIMLGFVLGTVDLLTGGLHLASSSLFTVSWAIVQSVSIDGLFFAVLSQLKGAAGWKRKISLGIVMISLALVAFLVNDILSFQQVNGVSMALAMQQLGISALIFTPVRAGLVVAVSIASALVLERKQDFTQVVSEIVEEVQSIDRQNEKEVPLMEVSVETADLPIEESDFLNEKPALRLVSPVETEKEEGPVENEVERYMRLHQCSRATAYRRMKQERQTNVPFVV